MPLNRLRIIAAAACLLALVACGCGKKSPTSPVASRDSAASSFFGPVHTYDRPTSNWGGFYPLAIGNRWDFLYHYEADVVTGEPYVFESHFRDELTHRVTREGRNYVVDERTWEGASYDPMWIEYRQDRDGLYEWDGLIREQAGTRATVAAARSPRPSWPALAARLGVPVTSAPWRAAWEKVEARCQAAATMARHGGVAAADGVVIGEIQRLAYPLRVGQAWDVRTDPHFWSWVIGQTKVRTPAGRFNAWAIGISNEYFGPNDHMVMWYSREGYLGYEFHFTQEVTDELGNPLGELPGVQSETLVGLHLVRSGLN